MIENVGAEIYRELYWRARSVIHAGCSIEWKLGCIYGGGNRIAVIPLIPDAAKD